MSYLPVFLLVENLRQEKMRRQKDYKSEYAVRLVEWFRDAPLFIEEAHEVYSKKMTAWKP